MAASEDSPRAILKGFLQPLLPEHWKFITHEGDLDALAVTTVFIRQKRIGVLPEAPLGLHKIEFTVSVATSSTDLTTAEDVLDDELNAFLHAVEASPSILWTGDADKVLVTSQNIGYDFTLSLTSRKEDPS